MTLKSELEVFRLIDKHVHTDPDYWPTFQLQNVRIVPNKKARSKHSRHVSLLEASVENPVCVIGELDQVEEENLDRVLGIYQNSHDGFPLVLPHVTNFRYGEQDGRYQIWAEGQAGWFEIQPAEQYQDVFLRMIEALTVWSYLEDQHSINASSRGPARNPDIDTLIELFLKQHPKYEIVERVEGVFLQNQSFLLSQMKDQDSEHDDDEISERPKWAGTNIYEYFIDQTPPDTASTDDDASSGDEAEITVPTEELRIPLPQRRMMGGKATKSAVLRPTGLTPRSTGHKAARASSALAMSLEPDDGGEQGSVGGDERRKIMVSEMKKAGASTGFLEAFLEGRDEP